MFITCAFSLFVCPWAPLINQQSRYMKEKELLSMLLITVSSPLTFDITDSPESPKDLNQRTYHLFIASSMVLGLWKRASNPLSSKPSLFNGSLYDSGDTRIDFLTSSKWITGNLQNLLIYSFRRPDGSYYWPCNPYSYNRQIDQKGKGLPRTKRNLFFTGSIEIKEIFGPSF